MAARILLVDDHALVRQGFRQLLGGSPDEFEVIADAGDATSALEAACEKPDMCIIDLDLGASKSGLEILAELRRKGSDASVLICSMTTAPQVVANALTVGADGYLFKTASSEETLRRSGVHIPGANALEMYRGWISQLQP